MKRALPWTIIALLAAVLAACGPIRKSMFPPTLSVQELHVQPDGHWRMQVRILNNGYGSVDFRRLQLTMHINHQAAARIDTRIDLSIPPLSADVTTVEATPSAAAAAALAAIANQGSAGNLAYSLTGTASAAPEHSKVHDYPVDSHDWLSPVPGVPDTYR